MNIILLAHQYYVTHRTGLGQVVGFLPWVTFSDQVASMNIQTLQNHQNLELVWSSIKGSDLIKTWK